MSVLRCVELRERFDTHSAPFRAIVQNGQGERSEYLVKPVRGEGSRIGVPIFREWCGVKLGQALSLPVPPCELVMISQGFIDSCGSALADVREGLAFASRWIRQATPLPSSDGVRAIVTNRDTVAGVTILDTVQDNPDRHSRNALVAPAEKGQQQLWFIDNEYSMWGKVEDGGSVDVRVPGHPLPEYVLDEVEFAPYLLMAEGMRVDLIEAAFSKAPVGRWAGASEKAAEYATHALRRALCIRSSLPGCLQRFPHLENRARAAE